VIVKFMFKHVLEVAVSDIRSSRPKNPPLVEY